jgi:pilus assembly protein CpaD
MAHSISKLRAATAVVSLLLGAGSVQAHPQPGTGINRGVDSVHQPTVSRTDYVLDVGTTPAGLARGETDRLTGWFEGLGLGYGDTVTIADPAGWHGSAAQDAVGGIVARYGMLVSHDPAPLTSGQPGAGTIRVVVSRAVARVEGCPDYSHGNYPEYAGSTVSNYGCSTALNLAAMIANPQDLVEGHAYGRPADAALSVKAIKTYRDAAATGASGIKDESSKAGGN